MHRFIQSLFRCFVIAIDVSTHAVGHPLKVTNSLCQYDEHNTN